MAVCLAVTTAVLVAPSGAPAAGGAVAGAATGPTGTSDQLTWSSALCPQVNDQTEPIGQTMDGRVKACLRAPDVPGGTYHLVLEDDLFGPATTSKTAQPTTGATPAVQLSVSPRAVAPGQVVRFTGRLKKPYQGREDYVDLCWTGCPGGLQYDGVPVTWRSGTVFTGRFTVPAAPWADLRTGTVVSPMAGIYELGVACVVSLPRCGLRAAEGETAVRLTSSARYTCARLAHCARLRAAPALVSPGDVVELTGYAPLGLVIGQPLVGDVVGQKGSSPPPGISFVTSQGDLGLKKAQDIATLVQVDISSAAVSIRPAPSFASLGKISPLGVTQVGEQPISANPVGSADVAWCDSDDLQLQGANGLTVIPTTAAVAALNADKAFEKRGPEGCSTVALGVAGAGAGTAPPTIYAGFDMATVDQDPVLATVPMYTTDGGVKWSFLPVPAGGSRVSFGGFRYGAQGAVEALFDAAAPAPNGVPVPLVEQASANGQFSQVSWSCPSDGPCLSLGAEFDDRGCAGGAVNAQAVLVSHDEGVTWSLAQPWSYGLATCGSGGVVALSATSALLLTGDPFLPSIGSIPASLTTDGGRTWTVVSLPTPPEAAGYSPALNFIPLPTGAVLDASPPHWLLLGPGARTWCQAEPPAAPPAAAVTQAEDLSFTLAGGQLWWLAEAVTSGTNQVTRAYHLDPRLLSCRAATPS